MNGKGDARRGDAEARRRFEAGWEQIWGAIPRRDITDSLEHELEKLRKPAKDPDHQR